MYQNHYWRYNTNMKYIYNVIICLDNLICNYIRSVTSNYDTININNNTNIL